MEPAYRRTEGLARVKGWCSGLIRPYPNCGEDLWEVRGG